MVVLVYNIVEKMDILGLPQQHTVRERERVGVRGECFKYLCVCVRERERERERSDLCVFPSRLECMSCARECDV